MENIFKDLKVLSGNPSVVSLSQDFSVELNGMFTLTKGSYTQRFSYYGRVYKKTYIDGYILIDDYDITDENVSIGGTKIDSIRLFKEMLTNSGLKSVSESFTFTDNEKKNAMFTLFENSSLLTKVFGDYRLWNTIPDKERTKIEIRNIIDNYDTLSESYKSRFKILDSEGKEVEGVPTKNDFIVHFDCWLSA